VQGWSWEGGLRGPSQAEAHIADFDILSKDQPVDQRIKLQCETHLVDHVDRLQALIQRHRLKYVVFSDRTSQMATGTAPDGGAWYLNPLDYAARATAALANARAAPRFVCQMAEFLDDHAVIYGSLNDPDGETRETYSMMGAKLCEKPAQRSAAALARAVNDPVILEASAVTPSGADRMAPALAEALASYGSETPLFRAALHLGNRAGWDLAKAWALVSSRPADLMHMADRGSIAYGKRADLVLYNPQTDAVEGTICAGRVAHLTGEAEARFFCARKENQSAAE
jgi:alpha-D-ribose 1-methylphosphonate 5-triphosphate diphosphatase